MDRPPITVALVEDVAGPRDSLTKLLGHAPGLRWVSACASGEDALRDLPPLVLGFFDKHLKAAAPSPVRTP